MNIFNFRTKMILIRLVLYQRIKKEMICSLHFVIPVILILNPNRIRQIIYKVLSKTLNKIMSSFQRKTTPKKKIKLILKFTNISSPNFQFNISLFKHYQINIVHHINNNINSNKLSKITLNYIFRIFKINKIFRKVQISSPLQLKNI